MNNLESIRWTDDQEQVDWYELELLYCLAPLGNKPAKHLQIVFTNSRYKFFAYADGRLLAAGRALADGADCAYICDVAVLPDHQGTGLGREMMLRLMEATRDHSKVILFSVPEKEGFYRKLGFKRLLTAMATFKNHAAATARGYLDKDD